LLLIEIDVQFGLTEVLDDAKVADSTMVLFMR